jgi:hypothetical protein
LRVDHRQNEQNREIFRQIIYRVFAVQTLDCLIEKDVSMSCISTGFQHMPAWLAPLCYGMVLDACADGVLEGQAGPFAIFIYHEVSG